MQKSACTPSLCFAQAFRVRVASSFFCSQAESTSTHKWLDEAVFAAYGWKSDLSDEEILEKLLSLNLQRSKS